MLPCEHFIYTTADTELKTGYQIIAKSAGIKERWLDSINNYLYPLGISSTNFIKSKSLIQIEKKYVAYSIVKNIGIGYDNRDGTLYNHTMIMKKTDFEKIEYDTRLLDKYFIEEYAIRGEMRQLNIRSEKNQVDFEYLKNLDRNLLSVLLYYIFKKRKIAILSEIDERLIQNLLSIIPPLIRFIPFSTFVLEPTRQTKYHLIQIPNYIQPRLQSKFVKINPNSLPESKIKFDKDVGIQNIIKTVDKEDLKQLLRFHDDFKKIDVYLSNIKRIKIENIFEEKKIKRLVENKDFSLLLSDIKILYKNSDFNKMSPRQTLKITKTIRIMLKKLLKEHEKNQLKNYELKKLISVFEILLDCLKYIDQYKQVNIGTTTKIDIKNEIEKIQLILDKYRIKKSPMQYEFDIYKYLVDVYGNALSTLWSIRLFLGYR